MNKHDKTRLAAGIIAIVCFAMAWVIFGAAYAHGQTPKRTPPPVYTGPEIQKCDKELWLRIKDGC